MMVSLGLGDFSDPQDSVKDCLVARFDWNSDGLVNKR